jgi:hypothetical protein
MVAAGLRKPRPKPNAGFDMSGRRSRIKGYFAALRLIVGAVMSSAANTSGEQYRFSLLRVSLNPPAIVIFNTAPTLDAL